MYADGEKILSFGFKFIFFNFSREIKKAALPPHLRVKLIYIASRSFGWVELCCRGIFQLSCRYIHIYIRSIFGGSQGEFSQDLSRNSMLQFGAMQHRRQKRQKKYAPQRIPAPSLKGGKVVSYTTHYLAGWL